MLLIIEALLISSALFKDYGAAGKEQIFPLDMALESVDDRYYGCRENMSRLVNSQYLDKELDEQNNFKEAWNTCKQNVPKNTGPFKKKHIIAMFVYTHPNFTIYKPFNDDTRNGKQNYFTTYKWHSLHFLLTDAILILKEKTQNVCYDTFRGTNVTFDENVLNREVRFGSFTSSSFHYETAKKFGSKSCFEIRTCEGANVAKYSWVHDEDEVLIPPYETFRVTAVKKSTEKKNGSLWCNTVFVLNSTGIRSDLNCSLIRKP